MNSRKSTPSAAAETTGRSPDATASALIDGRIAELADWRGKTLSRMRKLIHEAVPDVVEEWKWMGTPVWSSDGILCTGETYKSHVKLTFLKGATLPDPAGLFNASLDGNARRAIDIHEGTEPDAAAFRALIQAAAAFNAAAKTKPKRTKAPHVNSGSKFGVRAHFRDMSPAKDEANVLPRVSIETQAWLRTAVASFPKNVL